MQQALKYRPIAVQLLLLLTIYLLLALCNQCIILSSSAGYGGMIALINAVIVLVINQLSQTVAKKNPKQGVALVFVFAGVRFLLIGVLFAVGIGGLKLDALSMLVVFSILHLGSQVIEVMMNLKKIKR